MQDGLATPRGDDGRSSWLSRWKEWGIHRAPASASPAARSRLRQAVERALARFTVQAPEDEVRDAVDAAIEPILRDLAEREAAATRERKKRENIKQVETWLEVALRLRAGPDTKAMLGRAEHAKPVLVERLRRRWRRELTGEESDQAVLESTIAFVDRCLAKQPPPPRRWGRRLTTGALVTAVVTGKVLDQNPELRDLARQSLAAGRDKLRALLARVTSATKASR